MSSHVDFCSGNQCQKVVHRPDPLLRKTRIESLRVSGAYAEPGGTSFPFELVRARQSQDRYSSVLGC